ncbi:MAG: phosphoribosylformylglycinamidine synthase I [Chloroflexi bacterium]|nr:phosphoribosylformylglycinamidine synthase I [Chloroflexota bacterium]
MATPKALILRAPGTNCDEETGFAFELAGAQAELVHINELVSGRKALADYQILVIPGGFTYGDDISAGRILANEVRLKIGSRVREFTDQGNLVLGICNGLQVMVKAGILPPLSSDGTQELTLAPNDSGKFECRWSYLRANESSPCVFTSGMGIMYLPVAHGEGKVVANPKVWDHTSIAVQYCDEVGNIEEGYPHNPNGSEQNIAGICDKSGRIFALMPHPERHVIGTQHPRWTREGLKESGDGLQMFINAVNWVKST